MKFRKKPIIVEAFIWTGGPDQKEDPVWMCDAIKHNEAYFIKAGTPYVEFYIKTLEGDMRVNEGDWIIKGIQGEIYPCKPDIFKLTYEVVE